MKRMKKMSLVLGFVLLMSVLLSAQIKVKSCVTSSGGSGGGGTSVTDDFNRSDNTSLGANWTVFGGMFSPAIVSNQVKAISGGSQSGAYYSAATFSNNQYAQMTYAATAGTEFSVCVRMENGGSSHAARYCVKSNSTQSQLFKFDSANTATALGSIDTAGAVGEVFRIEITGSSITVKRNGTVSSNMSVTDSTITTGSPGFVFSGTGATGDNFAAGDL